MDKSLNSNPRIPWWMVFLQLSPLIIQLVSEIVLRTQTPPLDGGLSVPMNVDPGRRIDPSQEGYIPPPDVGL